MGDFDGVGVSRNFEGFAYFADGGFADLAPAHVAVVPMQDQGAAAILVVTAFKSLRKRGAIKSFDDN